MNKGQFVDYVAERNKIKKVDAQKMLDILTDSIINCVAKHDELFLVGFGRFYKNKIAARMGLNPKTKEKMHIDSFIQISFRAGQDFKQSCNN
jgi:DNA-binding protein HU-beta